MVNDDGTKWAFSGKAIILGARGFVGQHLIRELTAAGCETKAVTSLEADLTDRHSAAILANIINPNDALFFLSAITPDRGVDLVFSKNLSMALSVSDAIAISRPAHLIYVSSDAVYPFIDGLVNESTPAAPTDLYGAMHLSRELLLQGAAEALNLPLAILRPTLIFGLGDTHNSYGPNRFIRNIIGKQKIEIFGKGEETRDHIHIDDVVGLCRAVARNGFEGTLNLVTGTSIDYLGLSKKIISLSGVESEIETMQRRQPITHRHFDITAIRKAFPEFQFSNLEQKLKSYYDDVSAV